MSASTSEPQDYPEDELKKYELFIINSSPSATSSEENKILYRELQTMYLAIDRRDGDESKQLIDLNLAYMRALYAIITTPHEGTVTEEINSIVSKQNTIVFKSVHDPSLDIDEDVTEYYALRQDFCTHVAKLLSTTS